MDADLVPIVVEILYAPYVVVDNGIKGIKDTGLTSIPFLPSAREPPMSAERAPHTKNARYLRRPLGDWGHGWSSQ